MLKPMFLQGILLISFKLPNCFWVSIEILISMLIICIIIKVKTKKIALVKKARKRKKNKEIKMTNTILTKI